MTLAPSSHMDQPGIGLTSTNNDAMYYTSLGDWVKGHTVFEEPHLPHECQIGGFAPGRPDRPGIQRRATMG